MRVHIQKVTFHEKENKGPSFHSEEKRTVTDRSWDKLVPPKEERKRLEPSSISTVPGFLHRVCGTSALLCFGGCNNAEKCIVLGDTKYSLERGGAREISFPDLSRVYFPASFGLLARGHKTKK